MTKEMFLEKFEKIFTTHLQNPPNIPKDLLSNAQGKIYEAYILSLIIKNLSINEGLKIELTQGNKIKLKSSPGPINRNYPYFKIIKNNSHFADLFTDIEFTSFSYTQIHRHQNPTLGDYHELDIIVVSPNAHSRPYPQDIYLGIECKDTTFDKGMLRAILGVRREMGYSTLGQSINTKFNNWPASVVGYHPNSVLQVYCNHNSITKYIPSNNFFSIDFIHKKLGDFT